MSCLHFVFNPLLRSRAPHFQRETKRTETTPINADWRALKLRLFVYLVGVDCDLVSFSLYAHRAPRTALAKLAHDNDLTTASALARSA